MQRYWLYILRCGDNSLYVGHTDNLETRIAQHHAGIFGGHTSRSGPLTLVYTCDFGTRTQALERERQIKRWTRAKKEALIRGDWDRLRQLARSRSS
ncbi:MAG TPA: GIY-YIG nuclease family protein [Kofleriaceae bacterium]|nr:GIY-YIG nuclease family protein [Kofleriaceae bacterium]